MLIYSVIENDNLEKFKENINDDTTQLLDYLFFAVEYKSYKITDYILKKYKLVNKYKEKFGKSLMSIASENNDIEMMSVLLAHGEDINGNSLSLFNPLEISIIERNKDFFNEIIKKGCDINFFLPRHNRTPLDTIYMYELQEGKKIDYYKEILVNENAISTRKYFKSEEIDKKNSIISDYFGDILNYSFVFKKIESEIKIGFLNKETNFIFCDNFKIINILLLPFDWPLNNQEKYLESEYSFFFKFLDFININLNESVDDISDEILKDLNIPIPNNIRGFQCIELELEHQNFKKIKIYSPFDKRRKKFSESINHTDLNKMKYNWPKNKRGFNVYENFFIK